MNGRMSTLILSLTLLLFISGATADDSCAKLFPSEPCFQQECWPALHPNERSSTENKTIPSTSRPVTGSSDPINDFSFVLELDNFDGLISTTPDIASSNFKDLPYKASDKDTTPKPPTRALDKRGGKKQSMPGNICPTLTPTCYDFLYRHRKKVFAGKDYTKLVCCLGIWVWSSDWEIASTPVIYSPPGECTLPEY